MQVAIDLLLVGVSALLSVIFTLRATAVPAHAQRANAQTAASAVEAGSAPAGTGVGRVGPYALVAKIGAGAMGEVYRARHLGSGRACALKLLPPDAREQERRQFEREARAGARLEHPNTVTVYDYGSARDGTRYLAMELLTGISLQELVERDGAQAPSRVVAILLQIAAALREAHELGLVHRDVKPQNVLLVRGPDGEDRVKLIDFGLVKDLGEVATGSPSTVVGTPLYISPEAITTPDAVDGRSDLYALGAVAHFLLSGAPVFSGRSVVEVCSQHLLTAPEPVSRVDGLPIDPELQSIVRDCLAKDPSARPSSADELIRRLERHADPRDTAQPAAGMAHIAIACRARNAGWLGARCPAAACPVS